MDLAVKDIRRHVGKFVATIVGVSMLLAIVLVMNGIYRGNIADGVWLIENLRTELATLTKEAAQQTKAVEDIEAYKAELLAGLPIPGVEVIDGEIYREGVQFDRLNTSQQVGIAIEIAKLSAADLGIVCVDGCELMDSAHLEELRRQAAESGLQMFITRVTDDDFGIDTQD